MVMITVTIMVMINYHTITQKNLFEFFNLHTTTCLKTTV